MDALSETIIEVQILFFAGLWLLEFDYHLWLVQTQLGQAT